MNQNLLDNIKKTIEGLEASGILTNARIFLFGMNTPGDRIQDITGKCVRSLRKWGLRKMIT